MEMALVNRNEFDDGDRGSSAWSLKTEYHDYIFLYNDTFWLQNIEITISMRVTKYIYSCFAKNIENLCDIR